MYFTKRSTARPGWHVRCCVRVGRLPPAHVKRDSEEQQRIDCHGAVECVHGGALPLTQPHCPTADPRAARPGEVPLHRAVLLPREVLRQIAREGLWVAGHPGRCLDLRERVDPDGDHEPAVFDLRLDGLICIHGCVGCYGVTTSRRLGTRCDAPRRSTARRSQFAARPAAQARRV